MKKATIVLLAIVSLLLVSSCFALAQGDQPNRISFAFQTLLGPKVAYSSIQQGGAVPLPTGLANDETRIYFDGRVEPGQDGPGMFTENWGYESAAQLGEPDMVRMHHLLAPPIPGDSVRSPQHGFEVSFSRRLWQGDRERFEAGLVFAGGLSLLGGFDSHETIRGKAMFTTDTYWSPDFNGPTFPPRAPYNAAPGATGPRLKTMPARAANVIDTETSVRRELDGMLITGRWGPYVGYNLGRLSLLVSGGLAVGFSDAEFRSSSTTKAVGHVFRTRARENSTDALLGMFARGDLLYHFSERWSLDVGAQFLTLGTHKLKAPSGESAALKLKNMIGLSAGVSCSF